MKERYMKYKIEAIVNKILYEKKIIDQELYKETSAKLDRLLFDFDKKI